MATKPSSTPTKKDNADKNREARLLRTLKSQPNNKQVEDALKTTRNRRQKPKNSEWTASLRAIAKLWKEIEGRFDLKAYKAWLSSIGKKDTAYIAYPKQRETQSTLKMQNHPFSLGARAKDKYGQYVWK